MLEMTSKERILASLRFEETDRLCFSPLADNYFASSLEKQGYEYDLIKALRYIGCDIIERHSPCYREVRSGGVNVRTERDGKRFRDIYETPVGNISNCYYFENGAMFLKEHLIKTPEDAKTMAYIARHTDVELLPEAFEERKRFLGDDGIPTPTAPCSPLLETVQVLCGIENTTYFLTDEEEIMQDLFSALQERNERIYKALCKLDSPVVFCYEDTSTTIISKQWLKEYALPALNAYADILHDGGKKFITHMCGKLTGFVGELQSCLCSDGIDSLCPPTTGDLEIWDARKHFPGKILIGGIEPPSLVQKSEKEVLEKVEEILEKMPDRRGFILSTGDAVPHGTPVGVLKAIADLVKKKNPHGM